MAGRVPFDPWGRARAGKPSDPEHEEESAASRIFGDDDGKPAFLEMATQPPPRERGLRAMYGRWRDRRRFPWHYAKEPREAPPRKRR